MKSQAANACLEPHCRRCHTPKEPEFSLNHLGSQLSSRHSHDHIRGGIPLKRGTQFRSSALTQSECETFYVIFVSSNKYVAPRFTLYVLASFDTRRIFEEEVKVARRAVVDCQEHAAAAAAATQQQPQLSLLMAVPPVLLPTR